MGKHLVCVSWLCWLSTGVYASEGHSENSIWILPFGFRIKPFFSISYKKSLGIHTASAWVTGRQWTVSPPPCWLSTMVPGKSPGHVSLTR